MRGSPWEHSTDASRSSPAQVAASAASTRCCSRPRAPRSSSTTSAATNDGTGGDARRPSRSSRRSRRWAARPSPTPTTSPTGRAASGWSTPPSRRSATSHVLVNNAGILRDRVLVNMTEEEWDAVVHVHLKGHFVPDALGRGLLAGADEGGQGGEGVGHQHVVDLGPARQPGPDELRRRQVRHRDVHADRRAGARPLRRAGRTASRRRRAPGSPRRRPVSATSSRPPRTRRVRHLGPGEHLAARRVPRHRRTARSRARCSSCRAARCRSSRRGRWARRSRRTTAGRSPGCSRDEQAGRPRGVARPDSRRQRVSETRTRQEKRRTVRPTRTARP